VANGSRVAWSLWAGADVTAWTRAVRFVQLGFVVAANVLLVVGLRSATLRPFFLATAAYFVCDTALDVGLQRGVRRLVGSGFGLFMCMWIALQV